MHIFPQLFKEILRFYMFIFIIYSSTSPTSSPRSSPKPSPRPQSKRDHSKGDSHLSVNYNREHSSSSEQSKNDSSPGVSVSLIKKK